MIAAARNKGHHVAADNLQRFLNGTGGTKRMSVSWLKGFSAITSGIKTNQGRFEKTLEKKAASLSDGKTLTFTDHWDRQVTGGISDELYYASGTSTITSTGTFTLKRSGKKVTISGNIKQEWNDPYDWHAGLSAYIPGFGSISDSDALLIQQHRGAAPFHMTASWNQTMTGTYNIVDYWFDSSSFKWSK